MIHDLKSFNVVTHDDGRVSVSYDGSLVVVPLIDYNSLVKKNSSTLNALKKEQARGKENADLVSDLASYSTYSWYTQHKGAKKGCGRLADAMILANAVRGMSLEDIQSQSYPYKQGSTKRYDRSKIFSALSVKKPDDLERINGLLSDFPEVFEGIEREKIYAWIQKKASKGQGGKK